VVVSEELDEHLRGIALLLRASTLTFRASLTCCREVTMKRKLSPELLRRIEENREFSRRARLYMQSVIDKTDARLAARREPEASAGDRPAGGV
jgi:hypothetical protein